MENKQYIVALEIASSHIAGVVASVGGEGHRDASIVCYHEVPIVDCVRYGSIVNVDEVCGKTGMLLDRLQSDKRLAPRKIKSVYIALSGRSLCSHPIAVARDIDEQTPISKEFIGRIEREAAAQVEKADVLAVMPCKYELDGVEVANPIGSLGAHFCASMNVVTCRPQIKRNIQMVFNRLHVEIAGYVIAPIAAAAALLTEEERRLGCMLVDHGAETTAVTIYKNNRMAYVNVIPMGSRNITKDLSTLNILEEAADNIKRNYGDAMASAGSDLQKLDIGGVGALDVANYVTARAGEIAENVFNQLSIAGLTPEQLPAGIVAIGRGMRLKNMRELLSSVCKMPVRSGMINGIDETMELSKIPQLLSVVNDIASHGEQLVDCVVAPMPVSVEPEEQEQDTKHVEVVAEKKKSGLGFGKIFKKLKTTIDDSFDDDEDDEETDKRGRF